ncbi:hypothetical protein NESM_000263000 [Novymonas esmeraldas]|uniref:Uncharacterized protein n=1 Tax=Novymonas esmeraldas TaxID=1808958 RepID=A0AAW0F996_9TRYP
MGKSYLSQTQQLRVQQVCTTHKHLKELNLATEEALKYHDKYFAALEKVMSCLLNNSDAIEDVRRHLDPESAAKVQPTVPTVGRLAAAHSTWHASAELQALRTELEFLKEISSTGRHSAKKTKNSIGGLEKAAKKCEDVNSADYLEKLERKSGKSHEKLLRVQREENTQMERIENGIVEDMRSLAVSLSTKLVTRGTALQHAFASVGFQMSASFADGSTAANSHGVASPFAPGMAPAMPSTRVSKTLLSYDDATGTYGTSSPYPTAQSAAAVAVPQDSSDHGAATGVPLDFHPGADKTAGL